MPDPTPPPAPLSPEELDRLTAAVEAIRPVIDRWDHYGTEDYDTSKPDAPERTIVNSMPALIASARRVASLEAVERAARRMKLANDALVAYYADDSIPPDLDWSNRTQLDWNEAESDLYAAVDSTAAALDAARTTEEEK